MKRCPTCNRTFDEEWLGYCTEDGTALVASGPLPPGGEPPPTVYIPSAPVTNPQSQPFDLPGSYTPPAPVMPGWQPPPPPPPMLRTTAQKQGLAVTSLILGIFSITFGWCCSIGLISAPTAIILGGIL